jgi:arsenite methyltransferase
MAQDAERDEAIRTAVRSKYKNVAVTPEGHFCYPVGEESALQLGYDPLWLKQIPEEVVRRFVGVGNPLKIRMPKSGERVLDAGCGCGFDTFIAACLAWPAGKATGIDLTAEMLAVPRSAVRTFMNGNIEFIEGSLENIPFDDESFDLAISNGVLNLVPDKPAAFSELARVLRKGGALIAADLLVIDTVPPKVLASTDAWST